jgi:toxin ParE1/3/4
VVDVILTRAARTDLAAIDRYTAAQYGADAADHYTYGFVGAFNLLARHPEAGAPQPMLGIGIRCLVHRRHRVFYTLEETQVIVIRVLHHARDARSQLTVKP